MSLAAGYGSFNCTKLLIERGSDINNRDEHNITPFIFACLNGQLEIVQLLFKSGAELNVFDDEIHL